jgi:hypothetical protein
MTLGATSIPRSMLRRAWRGVKRLTAALLDSEGNGVQAEW